jgi:hypothetical protein
MPQAGIQEFAFLKGKKIKGGLFAYLLNEPCNIYCGASLLTRTTLLAYPKDNI